jgi:hypothetical protein
MEKVRPGAFPSLRRVSCALAFVTWLLFLTAGCNKVRQTNMSPLDAAGMHPESLQQLHEYHVNDSEVQQILIAGRAGMSEQGCVKLVSIARSRQRVFAEGDAVVGLLGAGMKESSLMELVRLDQLNPFAGEAAAMRLAGLSDDVVLDVARHRAKGEPVLAGARLAELRDAGYSNAQLVAELDRGITDKQADEAIARHNYAVGGHTFVRQHGRRR